MAGIGEQLPVYKGKRIDSWETPPEWTTWLIRTFGITMDLCASEYNAIVPKYYSEEDSCLRNDWPNGPNDVLFINPPFSDAERILKFTAWQAKKRGCKVIVLYKANFETKIWQQHLLPNAKFILFPSRRVNFCLQGKAAGAVPFTTVFAFLNIMMTPEIYMSLRQRGHVYTEYPEMFDFSCLS